MALTHGDRAPPPLSRQRGAATPQHHRRTPTRLPATRRRTHHRASPVSPLTTLHSRVGHPLQSGWAPRPFGQGRSLFPTWTGAHSGQVRPRSRWWKVGGPPPSAAIFDAGEFDSHGVGPMQDGNRPETAEFARGVCLRAARRHRQRDSGDAAGTRGLDQFCRPGVRALRRRAGLQRGEPVRRARGERSRSAGRPRGYAALRQGKARAEVALGVTDAAVRDYATVVSEVPQPQYLVEFGELLASLGRDEEAQAQYAVLAPRWPCSRPRASRSTPTRPCSTPITVTRPRHSRSAKPA